MAASITEEQVYLIYSNDLEFKKTTAGEFFDQCETFDTSILLLSSARSALSKNSFDVLIHADYDDFSTSGIPFNKHILFLCYKKYGIEATNFLLEKYFNSNRDFYTLPVDDQKTIIHLEHYRMHPETTAIARSLQNK